MSERHAGGLIDAALAFAIRVMSAVLMFGLQILLARLMPLDSYGGFVATWTWMLALGSFAALGFAESSLRFLPRYRLRGREGDVLAYWRFGLRLIIAVSAVLAIVAVVAAMLLGPGSGAGLIVLLVGLGLPFLGMEYFLEGIARSFGWFRLAAIPVYILRPLLIGALCLGLSQAGIALSLPVVGAVLVVSMAIITLGLALVIGWRLRATIPASSNPRRRALWVAASLPLLAVSGLEDLLAYADLLVLSLLATPDEVAIYFAAARALALANFVAYAAYLVSGRRFALDLAARDRVELQASARMASRLTFWSTLAAVVVTLLAGPYLLMAFGPGFADGYGVMAILAAGLVARSLSGQAGELLIVAGRQRELIWLTTAILAGSVALSFVLVPAMGITGAAIATALAMAARSAALVATVWRTERVNVFALGLPLARPA
jgi:O-antigen/teichoic acid export membrane protein